MLLNITARRTCTVWHLCCQRTRAATLAGTENAFVSAWLGRRDRATTFRYPTRLRRALLSLNTPRDVDATTWWRRVPALLAGVAVAAAALLYMAARAAFA